MTSLVYQYQIGIVPDVNPIIDVYKSAGLNRPILDKERIEKIYVNSNLILSAWDASKLVGIARLISEFPAVSIFPILRFMTNINIRGLDKN